MNRFACPRSRRLRRFLVAAAIACGVALPPSSFAIEIVDVTISQAALTSGYMNVFDLPSNGGAYWFGSGWGIADLNTSFPDSNTVNFTPNTIGDTNPFWYTPSGGPGATGNKIMEANLYSQPADGTYTGKILRFKGIVNSFTLQTGANPDTDYTFKAFIRDFAPDYSTVVEQTATITTTGTFSISLLTNSDPTRHVQYGLQMKGPDVWVTDVASKGSVTVTAVPEPSTLTALAAAGLVAGACGLCRRKRGTN
ncbi:MAG: PEP-CTERM sorting domain-containing protein [Planctomycetaceae bacterium]